MRLAETGRKLAFKRRRIGVTDYALRTRLMRGKLPFLVVRSSNRYVYAQIVRPDVTGDRTLSSASSKELGKFGWRLGLASIPAAYLVGYLLGLRAADSGVSSAVLDMGLSTPTKGNKAFAVVEGAVEAGMKVPRQEGGLIQKERLYGKHVAEYLEKVREKVEPSVQFSKVAGAGVDVEAEVLKAKENMRKAFAKEGA
ncbi:MAG: 50S ribosomal protein L18 [Candidatus Brockarchaeota archaeon]|nr:50S ribosomal protein L18 [Candidatus Brockarchaeota archaeon]